MKDILYPIFLKCSEIIDETFWVNIFENMAYGMCPTGVHIKSNHVYINVKQKSPRVVSMDSSCEYFFNTLLENMKSMLYISSKKDDMINKNIFYQTQTKLLTNSNDWSKIRKRSIRNIMLENYVSELKQKYNLTIKETRVILSVIKMYITFNHITPSNIIVKNNKIIDISNCSFDPVLKRFVVKNV